MILNKDNRRILEPQETEHGKYKLTRGRLETPPVFVRSSYDDMGLERKKILPPSRQGNASDFRASGRVPRSGVFRLHIN